MSNYPDDITPMHPAVCYMEGCIGKGPCPRCGKTDYRWMGYWGAVARWAKAWGITETEAERRISEHQETRAALEEMEVEEGLGSRL